MNPNSYSLHYSDGQLAPWERDLRYGVGHNAVKVTMFLRLRDGDVQEFSNVHEGSMSFENGFFTFLSGYGDNVQKNRVRESMVLSFSTPEV